VRVSPGRFRTQLTDKGHAHDSQIYFSVRALGLPNADAITTGESMVSEFESMDFFGKYPDVTARLIEIILSADRPFTTATASRQPVIGGETTRCCVSGPVSTALANLFDIHSDAFAAVGTMSTSRSSLRKRFLRMAAF